ncbi:GDSL-type esterase/lipase family protein [Chryseobacterium sp. ZHDP1]|uniref:GDSL-type esterase/lipase family protein n=1 Tax=Chryseobacterium sp. ZHDP1 TaxID=2838877 RepID=UPI001BDFCB0C|nr:GDSL-type esterase/lipase family protein [Chryseobacterium sp. ZHDP1]QWA38883.1 sialate O-acetylesterase [Chryseobacterium sp. ZHDP1]
MKYLFLLLLLFSCGAKKDERHTEIKKNDSLVTYTFNKKVLDKAKLDLQNSFKKSKKDIIFLGDSKTEGFPLQETFNNLNIKNRGIAGNTTSDVLSRLKFVTDGKPKEIFLEIGVNDISQDIPVVKTFENFKNICERIKKETPTTKLYIQSVLPTTLENKLLNPKIQQYNDLLNSYCKNNKLTFIDLNSHFLSGSEMNKKYTIDGIHLNAAGYLLWGELLKKHVL